LRLAHNLDTIGSVRRGGRLALCTAMPGQECKTMAEAGPIRVMLVDDHAAVSYTHLTLPTTPYV
jgi:hypothetical protein